MITPERTWERWEPMKTRNLQQVETARRQTERLCNVQLDPADMHRDFFETEDAFLNDTANALRMSRSAVERAAMAGEIEWRVLSCWTPIEARRRGTVATLTIRRWDWHKETFEQWRGRIRELANLNPDTAA